MFNEFFSALVSRNILNFRPILNTSLIVAILACTLSIECIASLDIKDERPSFSLSAILSSKASLSSISSFEVKEQPIFSPYTKRKIKSLVNDTKIQVQYNDINLKIVKSSYYEGQFDMTLNLYKNRDEVCKEIRKYLTKKGYDFPGSMVYEDEDEDDKELIILILKEEKQLMFIDALKDLGLLKPDIEKSINNMLVTYNFPGAKFML